MTDRKLHRPESDSAVQSAPPVTSRFKPGKGTLLVKLDEGNGPQWYRLTRGEKSWVLRTYSFDGVTSTSYAPGLPELELQDNAIIEQVTMGELKRLLDVTQKRWDDVSFWSKVIGRLDAALAGHPHIADVVEPRERQTEVPAIPLRSVYDMFVALSPREAQEHLARAFALCPHKLAQLFDESVRTFATFNNPDEEFTGVLDARTSVRAPVDPRDARSDVEISAILTERHQNRGTVENAPQLDFEVVAREVAPERATGTGRRGRRIDWLAMNAHDRTPILAELKRAADKNPFYALVQLLLYAAMLSTGFQQERLRRHFPKLNVPSPPPEDDRVSQARLDLYIVLVEFPDQLRPFLELARTTAQALVDEELIASKVRRIVCLTVELTDSGLRFTSEFKFGEKSPPAGTP